MAIGETTQENPWLYDGPHDQAKPTIGLKPSTPAPTLPQISKENLELVCWMALKPGKA